MLLPIQKPGNIFPAFLLPAQYQAFRIISAMYTDSKCQVSGDGLWVSVCDIVLNAVFNSGGPFSEFIFGYGRLLEGANLFVERVY